MSRYVANLNKAAQTSTNALSDAILTGQLDRLLEDYARLEIRSSIAVDANPIDNTQNLTTDQLAQALQETYGLDEDVIYYAGPCAADYVRTQVAKNYWRMSCE